MERIKLDPGRRHQIKLESGTKKAVHQKWARKYILKDILDGVDSEIIKALYNLTDFEYLNLLKKVPSLGKNYFKPLVPIRKAVKFHIYDEFLSGKSELAIAKELSMTIDQVVDAINEMEAEDEEYAEATGASLLNQPKELKLSEEELELQRLEKQARPFLQTMLRGLD